MVGLARAALLALLTTGCAGLPPETKARACSSMAAVAAFADVIGSLSAQDLSAILIANRAAQSAWCE